MGRAGIGVAGGGAFTGLGGSDDHHTAAAFGPQDDGAGNGFVVIKLRGEFPGVGLVFFYGNSAGVKLIRFPYPFYSAGHRECIIIGIEVGIGQGLAAGGDGGVIGGASGGGHGEGDIYSDGGILVVLGIGLIITNLHGYCNGLAYAQALSQLISNGTSINIHTPATFYRVCGRISSRVETQCSCILCQFVQICTNVIIDIDGLAGGVIVDLVHIDGAQLGAIRLFDGHGDIIAGEGVGANGGCAAVIVVPRIQAGFHCIGLGSSIINRDFLAAVYLVPPVGHTGHIVRGNGRGKNRSLFGGVAVFGVVMARYGCRDTLDGGFYNGLTIGIKYIAGAQQGVLISDSGNFAVGAAGELNGTAANFQLGDGATSCYGKRALCYFQFIYG